MCLQISPLLKSSLIGLSLAQLLLRLTDLDMRGSGNSSPLTYCLCDSRRVWRDRLPVAVMSRAGGLLPQRRSNVLVTPLIPSWLPL